MPGSMSSLPGLGRHRRRSVTARQRVHGWLIDRMPGPLRSRITLGGRELGLVALVGAVGLCAVAVIALRASASAPAPTSLKPPLVAASVPARPRPTSPLVAAGGARRTVIVDVAGAVVHPGVVTLPSGARVFEALKAAGGVRHGVDLAGLNRARVLVDGEQIVVGAGAGAGGGSVASGPSGGSVQAKPGLVSLNQATESDLEQLPGVGPVMAKNILAWRRQHGGFRKVDELQEVDGIGPKKFAKLKPLVGL